MLVASWAAAGMVLTGCRQGTDSPGADSAGAGGSSTGGSGGAAGQPEDCASATTVRLADDANYHFDGALDIRAYPLAELGDPLLDWSGLTQDLQGHDIDPSTELDYSSIVVLGNLTQDEVEARLSTNSLEQASITAYLSVDLHGATSAHLSDYTVFGNDVDIETYFRQDYGVWLLTLATGATPGVGTRMAAFLQPEPGGTETQVHLNNDSTTIHFTVDLHSMAPVAVPAGAADLALDWSQVTRKGDASTFTPGDIDEVMLAHYASLTTDELESRFLDVELLADRLWTAQTSAGTTASLAAPSGSSGPFGGIDDEGVWLLALRCSTCANPAPPFLARLQTCP